MDAHLPSISERSLSFMSTTTSVALPDGHLFYNPIVVEDGSVLASPIGVRSPQWGAISAKHFPKLVGISLYRRQDQPCDRLGSTICTPSFMHTMSSEQSPLGPAGSQSLFPSKSASS